MSWGWGGSSRNRKPCCLLVCILCLQPRRPTPDCLLGLPSFIKKAKAGLNLLGTSHLQRYSQTWLFGEDSPFSLKKEGSDFIPRLATEDPKWRPNDSLESGQVLSGWVQCGAGHCVSVFLTSALASCQLVQGLEEWEEKARVGWTPMWGSSHLFQRPCIQTRVSCVFSVHMFCSKVVCSIL